MKIEEWPASFVLYCGIILLINYSDNNAWDLKSHICTWLSVLLCRV